MKQKIVIKVEMTCDKCRSKAMALVAATVGVDSVALAGDGKDQLVVIGDGIDSVKLTSALRRKVGPAQLVQVGEAKKEDEKKKPVDGAAVEYTGYRSRYYYQYQLAPPMMYEYPTAAYGYQYQQYHHSQPDTCSIM